LLSTDTICSLDDLRSEAESSQDNRFLHNCHVYKMLTAYWRGDYIAAEESFHAALAHPMAKMPQIATIYHTFFGGLVAFQLYRQVGGNNDQRLKLGREMMEKVEIWSQNSLSVHENKLLLLKAEYFAAIGEHHSAQRLYKASIKSAQDHGHIHELALAFELLGNSYCFVGSCARSSECFKSAYVYYKQWGAAAVAEKLMRKHNLRMEPGACTDLRVGKSKNPRE